MTIPIKTAGRAPLIEVNRPRKYNVMTQEMYYEKTRACYRPDTGRARLFQTPFRQ